MPQRASLRARARVTFSRAASVSDSGMKAHTYSTQAAPQAQPPYDAAVALSMLPMAGPTRMPTLNAAMIPPNPAALLAAPAMGVRA